MPRRHTRVYKRAKIRWAPHLEAFTITGSNADEGAVSGNSIAIAKQLAISSTDTAVPTPGIIKTGRYKLEYELMLNLSNMAAGVRLPTNFMFSVYTIYVPQGWPIVQGGTALNNVLRFNQFTTLIQSHPEWILGYKTISVPEEWYRGDAGIAYGHFTSGRQVLSSKLKRNLNSGDSVFCVLLCSWVAEGNVPAAYDVRFNCYSTYFTRYN